MNRHWTCADRMDGDLLHLFDCSHEDESRDADPARSFVTRSADVQQERLLVIQPNSLRFWPCRGASTPSSLTSSRSAPFLRGGPTAAPLPPDTACPVACATISRNL